MLQIILFVYIKGFASYLLLTYILFSVRNYILVCSTRSFAMNLFFRFRPFGFVAPLLPAETREEWWAVGGVPVKDLEGPTVRPGPRPRWLPLASRAPLPPPKDLLCPIRGLAARNSSLALGQMTSGRPAGPWTSC